MSLRSKSKKDSSRRQPGRDLGNSPAFSYYAKRSGDPGQLSRKTQREKLPILQRQWFKNLPSLIALTVVVVSVLYCLGLNTNPKILLSAPDAKATPMRSREAYQKGAEEILNSSIFNRSKLTINTDAFYAQFLEKFPEVADASLNLPLVSRRPVISIDTAQPQIILSVGNRNYVIDSRGKAIMNAADLAKSTRMSLLVVNDESGLQAKVGQGVLPASEMDFITQVIAQLKSKDISVQSIRLPVAAKEMEVRVSNKPYVIKFNVDTDPRIAAGDYLAVNETLQKQNITPSQYIDVRIEGRVYYK